MDIWIFMMFNYITNRRARLDRKFYKVYYTNVTLEKTFGLCITM